MHNTYLGVGHKITDIILLPISFVMEALHSWQTEKMSYIPHKERRLNYVFIYLF